MCVSEYLRGTIYKRAYNKCMLPQKLFVHPQDRV